MQFSFKNRLAFNFLLSTALIVGMLFVIIYTIVRYSVYDDVNSDINHEVEMHLAEINLNKNIFNWIDIREWQENEHNQISIDPVFVQIYDAAGKSIEKSPNLKFGSLQLLQNIRGQYSFDTQLFGKDIRQTQIPIYKNHKVEGYLILAMSLEEEHVVLENLMVVLFVSYLTLLVSLFFITRFIAGKSIVPILQITETANIISRDNLKSRITLPNKKDELFVLSDTINKLLDRIETAIEREKQFTSDASHELRTPLAVLKGTLEVLIRKPREKQEYEEKISFCINEVDRLNNLVDQLLLLARFENQTQNIKHERVYLNAVILDAISMYARDIDDKRLLVKQAFINDFYVTSDNYLVTIILTNILSNAIKYSNVGGEISISISERNGKTFCSISDRGIGIPKEDIDKIFMPFFRSMQSGDATVKGTGIGLSIVKRLCELLKIEITISSNATGTSADLIFNMQGGK